MHGFTDDIGSTSVCRPLKKILMPPGGGPAKVSVVVQNCATMTCSWPVATEAVSVASKFTSALAAPGRFGWA